MNTNIPKNCNECQHTKSCFAPYYGGSKCKHEKEINRKATTETPSGNPKK